MLEVPADRGLRMYVTVTRDIEVMVTPRFLPERSSPQQGYFFWEYRIAITNKSAETVQLRSRHWRITDALGRVQEVKGPGVVGKQPRLAPGDSFNYESGVPLETPSGLMVGTYTMVTDSGKPFEVAIPTFSLDSPGAPIN